MIDDPTQVTALMQKMKAHLPIPAQATKALVRNLRASAVNIASKRRMQIEKVMYLGDVHRGSDFVFGFEDST